MAQAVQAAMKAWQYQEYGAGTEGLHLVELPVPKPGPGELLIKVSKLNLL
jgi:NADPH:quinone reductase-like Zn-dependent oxidoreductase